MEEPSYYTLSEPDHRLIVWPAGNLPVMYTGEIDITGDRYAIDRHFLDRTMVYVPWAVVQMLSGN